MLLAEPSGMSSYPNERGMLRKRKTCLYMTEFVHSHVFSLGYLL